MFYQNHVDHLMLHKVLTRFFKPGGPIVYDEDLEGQTVYEPTSQYVIGPWAGPQAEIENLLHEMCHFAEREVDKLLQFPFSSWGFSYGKYWEVLGRFGYEPQTDASVLREQRVWAYQISLQKHLGVEVDPYDLVSSAQYMNAWCYYQPFSLRTWDNEIKFRKLSQDTMIMSQNEYTFEAFRDAWDYRIENVLPGLKRKRKRKTA